MVDRDDDDVDGSGGDRGIGTSVDPCFRWVAILKISIGEEKSWDEWWRV
jgi:hypothetical protein